MNFTARVAVVTGAAKGIGRAIAERYAREGLEVYVADRLEDEAQATAEAIGPRAKAVKVDITDDVSVEAIINQIADASGGIDVLVNNAGVFDMLPLLDVTRESYHRVFSVNVEGLLFTLQAVARHMVERGQGGKIINLASQAGRRGEPLVSVYCASKAAVISLTQSAGLALAKHRINVNAIAPGVIDTPMYDHVDSLCARYMNIPVGENKRQVSAGVPYGRMGRPDEIASMAAFLASDDADYIVAQTYGVDGGNWMA
jgi:D-sorbitol dehydrogenase (acceptor)